jgi:hypothetical protein
LLFWIGDEGKEAVGPSAEEEFYRTNEFNLLKDENFLGCKDSGKVVKKVICDFLRLILMFVNGE